MRIPAPTTSLPTTSVSAMPRPAAIAAPLVKTSPASPERAEFPALAVPVDPLDGKIAAAELTVASFEKAIADQRKELGPAADASPMPPVLAKLEYGLRTAMQRRDAVKEEKAMPLSERIEAAQGRVAFWAADVAKLKAEIAASKTPVDDSFLVVGQLKRAEQGHQAALAELAATKALVGTRAQDPIDAKLKKAEENVAGSEKLVADERRSLGAGADQSPTPFSLARLQYALRVAMQRRDELKAEKALPMPQRLLSAQKLVAWWDAEVSKVKKDIAASTTPVTESHALSFALKKAEAGRLAAVEDQKALQALASS